jgi:phosphatidylinositol 4-kinase A
VLLKYLSKDYENSPSLQRYVTKVLGQLEADQILFYLPQIFQALTLSSGRVIAYFLLEYARKSACFAHQLIWLAKVESKQERDPHNKSPRLPGVDEHLNKLQREARKIIRHTTCQFNREEKGFFKEVNDFYEQVTAISGKMRPQMPPADKKDIIH